MQKKLILVSLLAVAVLLTGCAAENESEAPLREDLKTSSLSCIKVGYTYYFSGITARDPETNSYPEGMSGQTKAVMDKYQTALQELGLDWNNVVKVNVYITDIADKPALNEAYAGYFEGFKHPCRVCVEAGLAGDAVVEIAIIAVKTQTHQAQP